MWTSTRRCCWRKTPSPAATHRMACSTRSTVRSRATACVLRVNPRALSGIALATCCAESLAQGGHVMSLEHTSEPGNAQVNRMHIERGAVAMGTDGPLGTVEQIVMNDNTGELQALVVRGRRTGQNTEEVEISA